MLHIYLLKDNRCGHCSQFQSTWDDLQNNIAKKNIQFTAIDNMFDIAEKLRSGMTIDIEGIDENGNAVIKRHYEKGVPTLIGKTKKGEFEYNGIDRSFENVSKWIEDLNNLNKPIATAKTAKKRKNTKKAKKSKKTGGKKRRTKKW